MSAFNRQQAPFWGFTLAWGAAFILPKILSEGTFFDGQIYACLARNLAEGLGSFWAPHFSVTSHVQWFEHPPLGVAIGSLFFRVFGDHIWVEHVQSLAMVLLAGALLVKAWNAIFAHDASLRPLGWLPLGLWLLNPQVTWAYANNLLENTMSILTFAAVWLAVSACRADRLSPARLFGAAGLIVAAVLTKDVVGFFPVVTCAVLPSAMIGVTRRRAAAATGVLILTVAFLLGALWLVPSARHNLSEFVRTQLLTSLAGERGGTDNHFVFLVKLLNTLLPAIGVSLVVLWVGWRRGLLTAITRAHRRGALGFFLLALAGSIPLLVSPRQSMFYVLPAFPFYALAMAVFVAPVVGALVGRLRPGSRPLRTLSTIIAVLCLAVAGWSLSRVGTYNRSAVMLSDVKVIGKHLSTRAAPSPAVIGACRSLWDDWSFETALQRYWHLGLQRGEVASDWMAAPLDCSDTSLADHDRIPLETVQYHLYGRRTQAH